MEIKNVNLGGLVSLMGAEYNSLGKIIPFTMEIESNHIR